MSYKVVGTCGKCGGPVTVPFAWWGTSPPVPCCNVCGAYVKNSYGPVLPMEDKEEKDPKDLLLG